MQRTRWCAGGMVVVLMLLAALSIGCGKEADQSSPEATVRSFFEAMQDGDGDRAAACIHGDDSTRDFFRAMANVTSAVNDLERAVKAEWGEEAWSQFDAADMAIGLEEEMEKLDEAESRIDGDRAYVSMPDEPDDLELVLVDGRWYIDAASEDNDMPRGDEAVEGTEAFQAVADAIHEIRDRIGEEGVTAESLSEELAEAMFAAMMGQ